MNDEKYSDGELVLIDIDKEKTIGEQMDLSHGLPFAPQKIVIKAADINVNDEKYSDGMDSKIVTELAFKNYNKEKLSNII